MLIYLGASLNTTQRRPPRPSCRSWVKLITKIRSATSGSACGNPSRSASGSRPTRRPTKRMLRTGFSLGAARRPRGLCKSVAGSKHQVVVVLEVAHSLWAVSLTDRESRGVEFRRPLISCSGCLTPICIAWLMLQQVLLFQICPLREQSLRYVHVHLVLVNRWGASKFS
jgi:hypothetical protein